jgi:16S rRNA (adenine1518-N6/adenine1519-N6)-dimethyltransferase
VEKINLTRPTEVRDLLRRLEIKPRRSLGQHFLIDRNILDRILSLSAPEPGDHVLEIGPGLGVVTSELLSCARAVTAIEMDQALCRFLRQQFRDVPNFRLLEGDALDMDLCGLLTGGNDRFISNLPYGAGSRILMELAACKQPPKIITVMVQRDVALRLAAQPGTKAYGLLSIIPCMYYEITREKDVSPTCFYPAPRVWSSIVSLRRREHLLIDVRDKNHFCMLVKWAFQHRRKQFGKLLRQKTNTAHAMQLLAETGIPPDARPENISVRQWGLLSNLLIQET